jgi:hypothetical protein
MANSVKLAELDIQETSGVDHPAHLHEGWLVLKSVTSDGDDTTEGESIVELEVTETEQIEEVVEAQPAEKAVDNGNSELLKELGDLRKELATMRAEKEQIEHEAALAKAIETASGFGALPGIDPQVLGVDLLKMRDELPEIAERIEGILSASAVALSESGVLKEIGSDGADESGTADAWGMIENRANDLVANGEANSFAKAVTLVAERDKDLYNTYLSEKGL